MFDKELERLKGNIQEIEYRYNKIKYSLKQNTTKTVYLKEYLRKLKVKGSLPSKTKRRSGKTESQKVIDLSIPNIEISNSYNTGVMLFLSPDLNQEETNKFSTRQPRREMIPTEIEEKLIIDYVRKEGTKITKSEYKTVYKKISDMLISAPKNAIAIQLKINRISNKKKILELFYHINVNNKVEYASFKYIEIKGVEYYRSLKST